LVRSLNFFPLEPAQSSRRLSRIRCASSLYGQWGIYGIKSNAGGVVLLAAGRFDSQSTARLAAAGFHSSDARPRDRFANERSIRATSLSRCRGSSRRAFRVFAKARPDKTRLYVCAKCITGTSQPAAMNHRRSFYHLQSIRSCQGTLSANGE